MSINEPEKSCKVKNKLKKKGKSNKSDEIVEESLEKQEIDKDYIDLKIEPGKDESLDEGCKKLNKKGNKKSSSDDNSISLSRKDYKKILKLSKRMLNADEDEKQILAQRVIKLINPDKKKRRPRTVMNTIQIEFLNKIFREQKFPNMDMRMEVARSLKMSPRSVQIWFQNQRQKQKLLMIGERCKGLDLLAEAAEIVSNQKYQIKNEHSDVQK